MRSRRSRSRRFPLPAKPRCQLLRVTPADRLKVVHHRHVARHYWSGHLVTDLHPETVSALCEHLDETPGLNIILLEPLTGLARRIDPESAAFPAREARWNVPGLAVWSDPQHDEAQVA